MLKKLLKYEYRATARIFIPFYIAILILSFLMSFQNIQDLYSDKTISSAIVSFFPVMIGTAYFGLFVMTVIMVVKRFDQNLLSDEGYLMFTLPVRISELIWSKMLISLFWIFVSSITFFLSMFLIFWREIDFRDISHLIRTVFSDINYFQLSIFVLSVALLSYFSFLLMVYASLSVSQAYSITKSRIVGSIFVFIALSTAFYFIRTLCILLLHTAFGIFEVYPYLLAPTFSIFEPIVLLILSYLILKNIVLYFLTHHHLIYKLNLD